MNKIQKLGVIAILPVLLVLSACSTGPSAPDPHASSASSHTSPAPKQDSLLKGFGDVITYTDGISISVSAPVPYSPSAEAAGAVKGQTNVIFTTIVTNHSKTSLELSPLPAANSGGEAASAIIDFGTNVGNDPDSILLPGQTIKWTDAYSVADPKDITYQVAPSFEYKTAIFDSKH